MDARYGDRGGVSGIGLGLAVPNIIAPAMEIVPGRWRVLAIVLVNCGYPLGSALGSAWVGAKIPAYGYPVTFGVQLQRHGRRRAAGIAAARDRGDELLGLAYAIALPMV